MRKGVSPAVAVVAIVILVVVVVVLFVRVFKKPVTDLSTITAVRGNRMANIMKNPSSKKARGMQQPGGPMGGPMGTP